MIHTIHTVAKRFNTYQRERFPVIVLGIGLLPAIFSSAAVVLNHLTLYQIVSALIASIAYLFHIRVIDEHRDFEHDNEHHMTRPVQMNVITKRELRIIDVFAVILLVSIAVAAGINALIIVSTMLLYSYLAEKEFFVGEKIRKHFFIYNGVNVVQMLLLQIFIYTLFLNTFQVSLIIVIHFLFTTSGTLIIEFIRKVKVPGQDGTGKDTYTWYLGFNNSLVIYSVSIVCNIAIFFWLSTMLSNHYGRMVALSLCLIAYTYLWTVVHWTKKTLRTNQLMQLSFLSVYGILNIAIYFMAINQ